MGQDVEGNGHDLIHGNMLQLARCYWKNCCSISKFSDQTLNFVPSEYGGVLISRPRRSVTLRSTRNSGAVTLNFGWTKF